eukprot:scaffold1776_cov319-Pinguiococcus_pyrenoidosus.AAC.1
MLALEAVACDPGRVGSLEAIQDVLCPCLHRRLDLLLGRREELLALPSRKELLGSCFPRQWILLPRLPSSSVEEWRLHQLSCAYRLCASLERLVQVQGLLPALDTFQGCFEPRQREDLRIPIVTCVFGGLDALGTA